LRALPVLEAYRAYYRRFKKTYHVQLQLESVVFKDRSLPAVNPAVDACFAAELETGLLTASHDLGALQPPVGVDASRGEEELSLLTGGRKQIKAGDMMMRDAEGVVCTIIYGQDRRTAVTKATQRVLYVTYVPPGIAREIVAAHHAALARNVRLFAPAAETLIDVIMAAQG
jgi:DNA/RNA-binding domain of Phe-tRNA-synthetase-like protein